MTTIVETPVYKLRDRRTLDFYEDERIETVDQGRYGLHDRRRPLDDRAVENAARLVLGSVDNSEPYERTEAFLADLRQALGRLDSDRRHADRVRLAKALREATFQKLLPGEEESEQRFPCAINSVAHHTRCRVNGRVALEGVPGLFCRRHSDDARKLIARRKRDTLEASLGITIGYHWPEQAELPDEAGYSIVRAAGLAEAVLGAITVAEAAGVDVPALLAPYIAEWGPFDLIAGS
jgi:hypothetical protein